MGAPELDGVLVVAPDGERISSSTCQTLRQRRLVDRTEQAVHGRQPVFYSVYVNTQGVAGG